jgi:hypothetical protein
MKSPAFELSSRLWRVLHRAFDLPTVSRELVRAGAAEMRADWHRRVSPHLPGWINGAETPLQLIG